VDKESSGDYACVIELLDREGLLDESLFND
jgi:hypothetical protein